MSLLSDEMLDLAPHVNCVADLAPAFEWLTGTLNIIGPERVHPRRWYKISSMGHYGEAEPTPAYDDPDEAACRLWIEILAACHRIEFASYCYAPGLEYAAPLMTKEECELIGGHPRTSKGGWRAKMAFNLPE